MVQVEGLHKVKGGYEDPLRWSDLDIFYASTNIIMGNGAHTPFWDPPWVNVAKPKEIAAHIWGVDEETFEG